MKSLALKLVVLAIVASALSGCIIIDRSDESNLVEHVR